MNNKRKVFYGISADYIGTILIAITGFAVVPFYFRYVSAAEYGGWLAVQGVIGMLSISEFGGDVYLTTKIADDALFRDVQAVTTQVSTMLFLKTILAAVFIVSGFFAYFFLGKLVHSNISIELLHRIFLMALTVLVAGAFSSTFSTILTARHHYSMVNSTVAFFSVLAPILSLVLLIYGCGIESFPLGLLVSAVLQLLVLFVMALVKYPFLRFSLSSVSSASVKDTYNYSKKFYFLRLATLFRTNYLLLVISSLTSASYVTVYNLTNRIPAMVPVFFSKISSGLFPTFARFHAVGDTPKIRDIYMRLSRLIWRAAFFFLIVVLGFNKDFVRLWVGLDKYSGFWVMLFVSLNMFVLTANSLLGTIVFATAKYEKWPQLAILEIVLSIVLSYLFAQVWGFQGIVLAFLLSSFVTAVYLFSLVNRFLNVTSGEFFRRTISYMLVTNISTISIMSLVLFYGIRGWKCMVAAVSAVFVTHILFYDGFKLLRSPEKGLKRKIMAVLQI